MKSPLQWIPDSGLTLKAKLGCTVGLVFYALFPLDVLPDSIPVIGWIDDVTALAMLVKVWRVPTLQLIDVLEEQWRRRRGLRGRDGGEEGRVTRD